VYRVFELSTVPMINILVNRWQGNYSIMVFVHNAYDVNMMINKISKAAPFIRAAGGQHGRDKSEE
jgi:hypothetical protein